MDLDVAVAHVAAVHDRPATHDDLANPCTRRCRATTGPVQHLSTGDGAEVGGRLRRRPGLQAPTQPSDGQHQHETESDDC